MADPRKTPVKPPLDLLRPAVRAMPGYTPGEQVADFVKLNTNEGAFPPSPKVMAALAAIQGAELLRLPFRQIGRRYELPADLARQRAKMIVLSNPNNPSATLIPVDLLRALCDEVADRSIVVVDEAYVDFALGAGIDASMLPYLGQHPNLCVLRTFSKSYSLAGARLGLLFASPPIIEALTKIKDSYNVNAITQALGIAALEDRAAHEDAVRRTLDERARLEAALGDMGVSWPESAANFLLVEIGDQSEDVYQALKQQGLLVRFWRTPELRTKIRISVGKPDENDRLIAALRASV